MGLASRGLLMLQARRRRSSRGASRANLRTLTASGCASIVVDAAKRDREQARRLFGSAGCAARRSRSSPNSTMTATLAQSPLLICKLIYSIMPAIRLTKAR